MSDAVSTPTTFADLGLPNHLIRVVSDLGFTNPTDIQAAAIPPLVAGRDVCGVAQTGTGKTAAFGLPLLSRIDTTSREVQALVLTPTRELAIQVSDALVSMAATTPGLQVLSIYGGSSYTHQLRALKSGVHVVVGTPGRVIDLATRGALDLTTVTYLVLDEADEMLKMGFAEEVDQVLTLAGKDTGRQVALFSATMPPAIRKVAREHLNSPEEIATSRQSSTTSTINQTYAVVPFRHKVGALSRVLATSEARATLVFVRTRDAAEEVALSLTGRGMPAASISGDVPQREREKIVERLRAGTLDVLVATDVAARGLDVERIDMVVNFDAPREVESYVHRIGRTGRAGRTGTALTFLTPKERGRLSAIERVTRTPMTEAVIPTPAQVSKHRAAQALTGVGNRIDRGRLEMYREQLTQFHQAAETDPLDLAAALLALHVGDEGPEQGGSARDEETFAASFDGDSRRQPSGDRRGERGRDFGRDRDSGTGSDRPLHRRAPGRSSRGNIYRVAVGHTHGARPQEIVGAITGESDLRGSDLGKIEIYSRFSLVEVTKDVSADVERSLERTVVAGQRLRFRPDSGYQRKTREESRGGERSHSGPRSDRKPRHSASGKPKGKSKRFAKR